MIRIREIVTAIAILEAYIATSLFTRLRMKSPQRLATTVVAGMTYPNAKQLHHCRTEVAMSEGSD